MWCVNPDEILSHSKLLVLNQALHFPKSQYLLGILTIFFFICLYFLLILYQNSHLFLDSVISFIISKSEKYKSYDEFLKDFFHDSSLNFKTHTPSKLLQLIRYFFVFLFLQDSFFNLFFVYPFFKNIYSFKTGVLFSFFTMTKVAPNEHYVHVCEKNLNQECYGIKII